MKKKLTLALICLIVSGLCIAFSGYQFELIIFSHIDNNNFNSEDWCLVDQPEALFDKNGILDSAKKTPYFFSSDDYKLNAVAKKLNENTNFNILLHKAWYEPTEQLQHHPTSVVIQGGRVFQNSFYELMGEVKVTLRHYFDVSFNLTLAFPQAQIRQLTSNKKYLQQNVAFISSNQTRRTKSKELNFIDHPLYGVLFEITPINALELSAISTKRAENSEGLTDLNQVQ